jgi:glycosyltransferase involved in cell wall biosynthesis
VSDDPRSAGRAVAASVVVPVRDGEALIGDCLRALAAQSVDPQAFEVIVVDDGSRDRTAAVVAQAAAGRRLRLLKQTPSGAPAARNRGLEAAEGTWVAFTDADCLPTRNWLRSLLAAVGRENGGEPALGAAGRTIGHLSRSDAARFVDLTSGLDAGRHLSHPLFPFAPSGNVMYRHSALVEVGGFDTRYQTYEACDLHQRLRARGGAFHYEPRAVVLHRHRVTWSQYWRQQRSYGRGYGQFFLHYRGQVPWSVGRELGAWFEAARLTLRALSPAGEEDRLVRRGMAIKSLAQRVGFLESYWNPRERGRW